MTTSSQETSSARNGNDSPRVEDMAPSSNGEPAPNERPIGARAKLSLVLGGARSGKSAFAEGLISGPGLYLATAEVLDDEMAARVERHRQGRGNAWTTVEGSR